MSVMAYSPDGQFIATGGEDRKVSYSSYHYSASTQEEMGYSARVLLNLHEKQGKGVLNSKKWFNFVRILTAEL